MALIVGTNSYEAVADADEYFATRSASEDWSTASVEVKESALITATAIVDENPWIGSAVSPSQALAWPRTGAVYSDMKLGLVVTVDSDEVPTRVLIAVREQALHLIQNGPAIMGGSVEQIFESITVGPISLSDSNSKRSTPKTPPTVKNMIKPLLRSSSVAGLWRAW